MNTSAFFHEKSADNKVKEAIIGKNEVKLVKLVKFVTELNELSLIVGVYQKDR